MFASARVETEEGKDRGKKERTKRNETKEDKTRGGKEGGGRESAYVLYVGSREDREGKSRGPAVRPAELWTHSGFLQVVPAGIG